MKNAFFIIALLFICVAIFEFHPAVKQGRNIVLEEIYAGKDCGCGCIAESRPWYGTFNYWFWFGAAFVPVLVFSLKANESKWRKAAYLLIAAFICYGAINLAVHLMWDIRNGLFSPHGDLPQQALWDMGCVNVADGASITFALLFGWIPASFYVGLCLLARKFFQHAYKKFFFTGEP